MPYAELFEATTQELKIGLLKLKGDLKDEIAAVDSWDRDHAGHQHLAGLNGFVFLHPCDGREGGWT